MAKSKYSKSNVVFTTTMMFFLFLILIQDGLSKEEEVIDQRIFVSEEQSVKRRSLADELVRFNVAQRNDPVGVKQPPLVKEELIRALNYQHLLNDRSSKLDEISEDILNNSQLPPGTVFRFISGSIRAPDGSVQGFWVVSLSFFLSDISLLNNRNRGSADSGHRADIVIRANFNIR